MKAGSSRLPVRRRYLQAILAAGAAIAVCPLRLLANEPARGPRSGTAREGDAAIVRPVLEAIARRRAA